MLGETVVGRGTGHSKQSAEKAAAADALGSFTRTRDDAGTAL
jgi:dsRNA-specific ribonuclease